MTKNSNGEKVRLSWFDRLTQPLSIVITITGFFWLTDTRIDSKVEQKTQLTDKQLESTEKQWAVKLASIDDRLETIEKQWETLITIILEERESR